MLRVKLVIEYDGSNYVGWQRQDKGKSVQGEIEKSLKKFLMTKLNFAQLAEQMLVSMH